MWFGVITLFPEMFTALSSGVVGKAVDNHLLTLTFFSPRDFANDKHKTVDDHPYGGGPGMVMMAQPLIAAIAAAREAAPTTPKVIYLSPQGKPFTQEIAQTYAQRSLILIAGRYEGIDERVIVSEVDEEWSIGDYVLSGGELPAMVVIDAITRLQAGVLGDENSAKLDSLTTGLLKFPHYTRPPVVNDQAVPEVLLSGHHEAIADWRCKHSLGRTWLRRKDLLDKYAMSEREEALLAAFIAEDVVKK